MIAMYVMQDVSSIFDDLEGFEDYDGLIDSGDTSMDYDDYD